MIIAVVLRNQQKESWHEVVELQECYAPTLVDHAKFCRT